MTKIFLIYTVWLYIYIYIYIEMTPWPKCKFSVQTNLMQNGPKCKYSIKIYGNQHQMTAALKRSLFFHKHYICAEQYLHLHVHMNVTITAVYITRRKCMFKKYLRIIFTVGVLDPIIGKLSLHFSGLFQHCKSMSVYLTFHNCCSTNWL